MRHWLELAINSGNFPGVEWIDRHRGKFRVPWKHASRHGWDIETDASIFKMWAVYTGKYPADSSKMSALEMRKLAKVWKANFRCALNALQDIEVERGEGKSRGKDAFKVFRILPRQRKSKATKIRLNSQGMLCIHLPSLFMFSLINPAQIYGSDGSHRPTKTLKMGSVKLFVYLIN